MLNFTKPVLAQLFGLILILVGCAMAAASWHSRGSFVSWGSGSFLVLLGLWLFIEGRQPAKRQPPSIIETAPTPETQPRKVDN